MKICGIYKIVNPEGKIYIGSSKDIYKRWGDYKVLNCKNQIKLYNSFVKYGIEAHIFEVIAIEIPENILKYEHVLGTLYNVLDRETGLNLVLPGYNNILAITSQETIEKMRNAQLGKQMSPESIEKTRQAHLGRKNSEETILKMSMAAKSRGPVSEETKLKMSLAKIGKIGNNTGKEHTEEVKLKLSLAAKSRVGMKYNKNKMSNNKELLSPR